MRWVLAEYVGVYTPSRPKPLNDINSTTNKGQRLHRNRRKPPHHQCGPGGPHRSRTHFHFLRTGDFKSGVDDQQLRLCVAHRAGCRLRRFVRTETLSHIRSTGAWGSYRRPTPFRPESSASARSLYLADFSAQSAVRFTSDGSRPGSVERNGLPITRRSRPTAG
mgnify:CR=1 FL=1